MGFNVVEIGWVPWCSTNFFVQKVGRIVGAGLVPARIVRGTIKRIGYPTFDCLRQFGQGQALPLHSESVILVVCWNCNNETAGEHFCSQCEKIQPLKPGEDYFSFFGYPNRQLDIDNTDLERKFYSFSRQFHPDFFQQSSDLEKDASLEKSSLLNDAYRTLKDPVKRAEYIIQLEGAELGKAQAPPDLLAEMFELNEQLEELRDVKRSGEDANTLKESLSETLSSLEDRQGDLLSQLQRLFSIWDASPGDGQNVLRQMSNVLSQHSYVRNLVRDLKEELE